MDKQVRIIGIELEELERIITKIVTEQNRILSEELKALMAKKDDRLNSDHITTKDLMVQLGVSRNTIQNYRKSGLLITRRLYPLVYFANTAALYFFPQHKTIFISPASPFKKTANSLVNPLTFFFFSLVKT
jgi:hypothetical protein